MNPNPLRCDKSFTITYIKALKRSTIMKSIKRVTIIKDKFVGGLISNK